MTVSTDMTVDFSSGHRPLAAFFRSAVIVAPGQGDDLSVPLEVLSMWITAIDTWYKEVLEIDSGRRVHLLYHREIALAGTDLLGAAVRIKEFGRVAYTHGYGVSLTVDIEEAMAQEEVFFDLINEPAFNHVGLRVLEEEGSLLGTGEETGAFVERVIAWPSVKIGLIAPMSFIRDLGLLRSPVFNRADITCYPTGSFLENSLPVPPHPVAPCSSRFRLHVDDTGFFYPCLGLIGVPGAELGSVREPVSATVLGGCRPYGFDLQQFLVAGPALEESAPRERISGLPWFCEQHRLALLEGL